MKIGVLDYGAGNLASARQGLERAGATTAIISKENELAECDALVIPGVGSFNAAMRRLAPLREGITAYAEDGGFVLGICLGMQVLFDEGAEGGQTLGLGLIPGSVEKLDAKKLPHVGWNTINQKKPSALLDGLDGEWFYFVHSYACTPACKSDVLSTTNYENKFTSSVQRGNVAGAQFHPEKSGAAGRKMLENFITMVRK